MSGAYPAGERAIFRRLLKEQREGAVKLAVELARLLLDVRRATLVGLRIERAFLVIWQIGEQQVRQDEVGLAAFSILLRLFGASAPSATSCCAISPIAGRSSER